MRSGTSSFSHISSPASYHFTHSDDEDCDEQISHHWSDDEVLTITWMQSVPSRQKGA
jgi:hypothetical protein